MPMFEDAAAGASSSVMSFADSLLNTIVSIKGVTDVFHGLVAAVEAPIKAFSSLAKIANSTVTTAGGMLAGIGNVAGMMTGPMAAAVAVGVQMFAELGKAALQVAGGLFELGLAATPGGLQVFGQVIELLTTVLGQALTPAVVLVLAGLLTLAELLEGPLLEMFQNVIQNINGWAQFFGHAMGVLGEWIQFGAQLLYQFGQVLTALLPLLHTFVIQMGVVGKVLSGLAGIAYHASGIPAIAGVTGGGAGGAGGKLPSSDGLDSLKAEFTKLTTGMKPLDTGKAAGMFGKNLDRVINALQTELGKKGNVGFSGIAEVAKTVQMNAIQNDIQAETLKVQVGILDTLRDMSKALKGEKPQQPQQPPTKK